MLPVKSHLSPIPWKCGYFTSNKQDGNVKVNVVYAAYKSKTFKCSLTEAAECLLHSVYIDACQPLNEVLHKGIAKGILQKGRKSGKDDIKIQLQKLVEDHCIVYLYIFI